MGNKFLPFEKISSYDIDDEKKVIRITIKNSSNLGKMRFRVEEEYLYEVDKYLREKIQQDQLEIVK